jgi:hypothetical protein
MGIKTEGRGIREEPPAGDIRSSLDSWLESTIVLLHLSEPLMEIAQPPEEHQRL